MAIGAGVGDFVLVCHRRTDKSEGVAPDVYIGNGLFNAWHVTGDALVACASDFVMRVFFNRTYVRTVG